MAKAKVLIFSGYGTNCEKETAYSAKIVGSKEVIVAHFSEIVQERVKLTNYNFIIFPGGFLDGDRLGAAQAASVRIKFTKTRSGKSLIEMLKFVIDNGGLILGICNGFQLLVKLGFLPSCKGKYFERHVSLTYNDSAKFEDRWVYLKCNHNSKCVFTTGLDRLFLPIRHGEGKIVALNEEIVESLRRDGHIVMQYTDPNGNITYDYPYNPNGSILSIAGLTDPSGQVFGLMPHPEAFNHFTNHPMWTRREVKEPLGIEIFRNAVKFLEQNT